MIYVRKHDMICEGNLRLLVALEDDSVLLDLGSHELDSWVIK